MEGDKLQKSKAGKKNENLELGAGLRRAGDGGLADSCPGTDVENRRNPAKRKDSFNNFQQQISSKTGRHLPS